MIKNLASASYFKQMPEAVKSILLKALTLFIIWKLLYHLVLYPFRFPDRDLTQLTAAHTSWLYNILLPGSNATLKHEELPDFTKTSLLVNNKTAVGIADGCNALEIHVLYVGFLLCIPASRNKKLAYIILGIAGIYILNLFRCFGLAWLYLHNYSIANFAHHYLFKMIIYGIIFFTWTRFAKNFFRNV
ncbi:archaeosortase/exosortase family protein [Aridibaculum aurantiacum]|uniref:archaeosortase/exosortase family protein n=1 Tax=Aridibaculum aurantiacum TaxID=2810307 RepID=UPI001A96ED7F|nr:archaeosortase/exosortase family protein [Aridibaculum aurantiacum]